jgi:hypothetical protein
LTDEGTQYYPSKLSDHMPTEGSCQWEAHDVKPETTVLMQSMRILDQYWTSTTEITRKQDNYDDRLKYSWYRMNERWVQPLLKKMLLLAAMISCKIGVSAYEWTDKHFCPVIVKFRGTDVLAPVSKHACKSVMESPLKLWSVARHMTPCYATNFDMQRFNIVNEEMGAFGTDLLLVDPKTKTPVGVLPDFVTKFQTPEESRSRIRLLYGDLVQDLGTDISYIKATPPDDVDRLSV